MVALAVSLQQLHKDQAEGNGTRAGPAQAVFLFVFNTFFAIGWLGMTWLYPAEVVPLRIRAPTNALSTRYECDITSLPLRVYTDWFTLVPTGSSISWS